MSDRAALFATIAGSLLLLGTGAYFYARDKKRSSLGNYRAGRFDEAPVVDRFKGPSGVTTTLRASNDMGIEERIGSIQKLIEKSVMDPDMRSLYAQITAKCPERDDMCELKAIYKAVKKKVRYTGDVAPIKMSNGDVEGIDLYQSAKRTWQIGAGDCDDQAILISTLVALGGITPRLRVTAADKAGDWEHIYPVALIPRNAPTHSVPVDATLPGNRFGVEAPHAKMVEFDA